jgi:hypothetical protein
MRVTRYPGDNAVKRHILLASLIGLVLLGWTLTPRVTAQQGDDRRWFHETGHGVRQPFIDYFNRTGGVAQHGYPITDDYVDPQTGLLVQYFEKSRLEWHPGNPEPYRVQLGLLSEELGKRQAPPTLSGLVNDPNCRFFDATGHIVCHAFLEYFDRNGGLDRFGYPITGFIIENERTVQYFQRARMEWHPDQPRGHQVQLAPLGYIYYLQAGLPRHRLAPSEPPNQAVGRVDSLVARGSVMNPVAVSNGPQTAFVYVTNQLGEPLGGAAVSLVIHYADRDEVLILPPTSASGVSFRTFTIWPTIPGTIVSMEFIIGYDSLQGNTRTSFLVWY